MNEDPDTYDLHPPPAPPADEISSEKLPLPHITLTPAELPQPDTRAHVQFLIGCLCSWVAGGLVFAATYAPVPAMIFVIAAVILAFVGAVQWGLKRMSQMNWRHFFPGMAFGLATASFIACSSCLASWKESL